ncbi:MAG: hypothetical protein QM778_15535 [Myxococcales bacterium]
MKNAIQFVSVEESALESVAGGLADIGNGSVNHNNINVASFLSANTSVGDVGSYILNILNDVSSCCPVGGEGPLC